MRIQQVFAAALCFLLASQEALAVVNNNAQAGAKLENEGNSTSSVEDKDAGGGNGGGSGEVLEDSVAAAVSDGQANKRDAPLGLGDTYGPPVAGDGFGLSLVGGDTYLPPEPSNLGLPQPVYGVPNNNVVYPGPPPDIPPPPVSFQTTNDIHLHGGPPKDLYGPPKDSFRPPPPPRYGPPPFQQRLPKPYIQHPFSSAKGPKPFHGPPPQIKPHFKPKPLYGPPKLQFRPLKPPKSAYGPPKFSNFNGGYQGLSPPKGGFSSHKFNHGPPQGVRYGPPEPVPHGPPHPGAPAPPTPPEIKYDGWQPIPGLVSRPPSNSYGPPSGGHGNLQLNVDFTPPSLDISHGVASFGQQLSFPIPSDSYGVPLNAVTGDEEHPGLSIGLASVGLGNGVHDDSLSVVKSIGYELYLNNGGGGGGFGDVGLLHTQDTYSAPPLNSYSSDGPYAAAHSYNTNGATLNANLDTHGGLSLSSSGLGLIPPSGVYGVPPSGSYGTPLLLPPRQHHGHALNALEINPPKHPVIFREPVPNGLIESIGNHVAQKDAHGIIEHSSSYAGGPTYIPPPVPDVSKPVNEEHIAEPSNLYSLPTNQAPVSFQSVVHEPQPAGLGGYPSDAAALSSYQLPLGSVEGSYALPVDAVALDHSHAAATIDLTANSFATALPASYGAPAAANFHDCGLHKSQPLALPSYASQSYANYDLQASHSQSSSIATNAIEGKALADGYAQGAVDLNNIPLQGAFGTYTLQIQPADALGSSTSPHVPHEQLLNDGLLRSILAAIEQPRQKAEPQPQQFGYQPESQPPPVEEEIEGQHSSKSLAVAPPSTELELPKPDGPGGTGNQTEADESPSPVESNEIALYFKRSSDGNEQPAETDEPAGKDESKVLNGQQYGSYVSFRTPQSGYAYGSAKTEVKTR